MIPSRNKWIAFALVALLACGAALRFYQTNDPDRILAEAQRKLWETKTLRHEIALEYEGMFEEAEKAAVTSRVRTDADMTDPSTPESVSVFEMRAESGGSVSSLAGETRRTDGKHFLKLAKATGAYESAAEPVAERWAYDEETLMERILPGAVRVPVAPAFGLLRVNAVPTISTLVRRTETLSEERSGGRTLRHYRIAARADGTLSALFEYAARASQGLDQLPDEDEKRLRAIVAAWGEPTGEAWIDRKTGRFSRLAFAGRVTGERIKGDVRLTIVFSREGMPVEIEAPVDARLLDDLLAGASDKHLKLAGERTIEEKKAEAEALAKLPDALKPKDTDGDGLIDSQEFFYGSNYLKTDTDGDGVSDGWEVKKGLDPAGPGALFGFGL